MSPLNTAASLPPQSRLAIAIKILVKIKPVALIAKRENVSRKFVYRQKDKAVLALNQTFFPTAKDNNVLFKFADHSSMADSIGIMFSVHLPQFLSRCCRIDENPF